MNLALPASFMNLLLRIFRALFLAIDSVIWNTWGFWSNWLISKFCNVLVLLPAVADRVEVERLRLRLAHLWAHCMWAS